MGRNIECCCTNLHECIEAQIGGAKRIELCENLHIGGITPSLNLIKEVVRNINIPVNVLIRPRGGNFVYSKEELEQMVDSIESIKKIDRINGFVIGALTDKGDIDCDMVKILIDWIKKDNNCNYMITFHRAFDRCNNPFKALSEIISLGCNTLLTSGLEENAHKGKELISKLIEIANNKISIMPGRGVNIENIVEIDNTTRANYFHSSAHNKEGITDRKVVAQLVNL